MTQELADAVLNYHVALNGDEYADALFRIAEPSAVIDFLAEMLLQRQHVGQVGLVIRDLVLLGWSGAGVAKFNELYEASRITKELETLVIEGDFWDRRQAVYVLGKTYVKSSVPVFSQALSHWLERDPLILPRVFFERSFLDVNIGADAFESIISSPSFMTRWAALQILTEGVLPPEVVPSYFDRLKQDPHPLVLAAAQFESRNCESLATDSSPEAIQQMLFNNAEPPDPDLVAFVNVENWFSNYLRKNQKLDYLPEELEAFVKNIVPQLVAGRRAAAEPG